MFPPCKHYEALPGPQLTASSTAQHPDDVVITLAIRTPLAKGKKGGFKDTDLDFLVYSILKKVLEKSKIDPNLIEDVCMGNVRSAYLYHSSELTLHRSAIAKPRTKSEQLRSQQASPPQLAPLL